MKPQDKQLWGLFLPLLLQSQLPLLRLNSWSDSSREVWSECVDGVLIITLLFFVYEAMWRGLGARLLGLDSRTPFWHDFLRGVVRTPKAMAIVAVWLALISVVFAVLSWGGDVLMGRSARELGSYFALSLAFNIYLAALFGLWHLLLAPRLFPLTRTDT